MAPSVSFTTTTLSYPLYAADFDPYGRGYLVVGGGGGEGRSGIANKITLLDASSRAKLSTVAEIDLSRDDDSVTSLASLATKDGLVVFAGINSSSAEKKSDKNEHLRSFIVEYPAKRRRLEDDKPEEADNNTDTERGKIEFAGKVGLFTEPNASARDTYQRIVRLSPPKKGDSGNRRLGAVATGLAPEGEIVIFDATSSSPKPAHVVRRVVPKDGAQAEDVDISEPTNGTFNVAYCTTYSVYCFPVSYDFEAKKTTRVTSDPILAHSTPFPDVFEKAKKRPEFRALRWLTSEHVVLLLNHPGRTGAELLVLRVYPAGGPALVIVRQRLRKSMRAGVALDVCALDADPETGARDILAAVAGQDISIEVLTIEYLPGTARNKTTLGKLRTVTTIRDVHPLQMTAIRFAPFHPPPQPRTSSALPQCIRLASVSMGNTAVVDTFALSPLDPKSANSRYILSKPGREGLGKIITISVFAFVLVIGAILLQSYLELRGGAPDRLVSERIEKVVPDKAQENLGLRHLLRTMHGGSEQKAIIVRDSPTDELSTEVRDDAEIIKEANTKRWEDLEPHDQERWKQRLVEAGQWSIAEGETF